MNKIKGFKRQISICLFFFLFFVSSGSSQSSTLDVVCRYGVFQERGFSLSYAHFQGKNAKISVLIFGGIHGNEPAGALSARRLIEIWPHRPEAMQVNLTVIPRINVFGLWHNQRRNQANMDLNRKFRDQTQIEIRLLKKIATKFAPYDLFLDLHEDGNAPGCYLYELVSPEKKPWGGPIIFADYPKHLIPFDQEGNQTYFQKAVHGVATYGATFYKVIQTPGFPWSSMIWASLDLKIPHTYTLETPKKYLLEERIETTLFLTFRLIQQAFQEKE